MSCLLIRQQEQAVRDAHLHENKECLLDVCRGLLRASDDFAQIEQPVV